MNDENEENMMQQGQQESAQRDQASEKKKEMAKKVAEKATKKLASKGSLMAPLAHIVMIAAPILIAIIILGGIIVFFLTMPGMVMDQLKGMFEALGNYVASFFGADTTEQIKDEDVYETLDYLEQMGYDLKGFGFLTGYVTNLSDVDTDDYDDEEGAHLDEDMGVIRSDEDDSIIYAKSDFIFSYIASDNYVYTLANDNIATQQDAEGWLAKLTTAIATAWYRIRNATIGPIFDMLGITTAVGEKWGKGLINLYYEESPKNIGEKGTFVNQGSLWNWDNIKINVSNKTLSIAKNDLFNSNNPIEFSLDGWSGRYGMPIEFLLSMHIATMMPDLSVDMIQSFPTKVNVYLHETSGDATAGYEIGNNQYVSYETLQTELSGFAGKNWFTAVINWFDNWFETSGEVEAARQLGIDVGTRTAPCTCEFTDDKASSDGFKIKQSGDKWVFDGECKDADGNVVHEADEEYEGEVVDVGVISSACEYCKKKLEAMTENLADSNDYNFNAYTPYIANVENHWYRDVYFISKVDGESAPNGFVENDYDYEAVTGERWTLYETYDQGEERAGDFKLYKVNENGETTNELYDGTREKAEKEGIAVAKKAVLIKAEQDVFEDLGWEETGSKWTAYGTEDTTSGYERIFTDEEIEEKISSISDDTKKQAYKDALAKLYVNLNLTENIVQKGEGLRTETNPTIKKMFLQSQYFKYDGTAETAEVITKLRENHNIAYGALKEADLSKSVSVTDEDGNTTTRKVSEVSGKVSLNQDSLNAFSMLENTHTLDADFIYRDFKELIVELGYFEKEELTDETPKLLQWIVPEISSGGFPKRSIDKNENEFGTMVHSEGDIKADEKNTFVEKLRKFLELENEDGTKASEEEIDTIIDSTINGMANQASMSVASNLTNVGAVESSKSVSQVSVEEFLGKAQEMCEYMNNEGYDYCAQAHDHTVKHNGHGLKATFEESKSLTNVCCATMVSWVLQDIGVYDGHTDSATGIYELAIELGGEPITEWSQVQPGDILFYGTEGDCSHTEILGEEQGGGTFTKYNTGHAVKGDAKSGSWDAGGYSSIQDISGFGDDGFAVRLNWGKSSPSGSYTGYKGNEAVVSPVTGILLDYGTYDGVEDKSSITDELYRQNVDLKYQKSTDSTEEGVEGGEGENNGAVVNPEYDPSKPDLVGYAKILVLDSENYKKLEANSGTKWASSTLVSSREVTNDSGDTIIKAYYADDEAVNEEEKLKDLSEIEKTVYGYKEFAESYESGGISGYVVYIDGFECYKPDEEFTEEQLETEAPSKDDELKITLDSFKKITTSNIENPNEDDVMDSLYEKDESHKMASKKATEKLKASVAVKEQASSTMYVDNLIFIKEGTVLGRTITDFQLIESPEYRGETGGYSKYRTVEGDTDSDTTDSEEEEDTDAVIGNYLRIIFRDLDDSVVEDVETYMKIDELDGSISSESQPYQAQPGDLELLANLLHHEGCESYFTGILGDSKLGADASRVTGYVVINRALLNYGGHGTTIREQILAPGQYSTAYDVTSETASYCDLCLANAEWCLKYDCSSVISPQKNTPMPRNVVGQSGWCQCSSDLGEFDCWWWIDTNGDGQHTEYTSEGNPFDTFYCQNTSFPED